MRILVLSDSHGKSGALEKIIEREKEAKHIFFLGDVLADVENLIYEYTDRTFHTVCGNCDYLTQNPAVDIADITGKKIFFTHGHLYGVAVGTDELLKSAKKCGADIALFGHTHIPLIKYEDGVYIVNPGSVGKSREGPNSYAVIDITNGGILPAIKKV